MNEGTWDEPAQFPKTRSAVPITIELNGKPIFAKGSNWVNPEIFNGEITSERYGELLQLAKDANMNILRVWGGAIVNKEAFFEWCDKLGIMVWQESSWICKEILERYFGEVTTLEQAADYSQKLQCAGYKAIFEAARRQKPYCSMAINWCYCEPWKTVANNSLISYPAIMKPAYYAVQKSLQNVVASANIGKFMWKEGEIFSAELWLFNDSPYAVEDTIDAYILIGDKEYFVMRWKTGVVEANKNKRGNILQFPLEGVSDDIFYLKLVSKRGYDNTYMLKSCAKKKVVKTLNN